MPADFSRVRLNALLDYAGVELKQGAVVLDADFNESTGIIDRRLRALASDVFGRATVSATTPDAFKIAVAGGTLQVGKGRLYVDGLLAENHGAASTDPNKLAYDDLLGERVFVDPILYTAQPYLSGPGWPAAPALPTAGRHLVYLDVWNREVTDAENPDLIETAVGVETTSRVQTAWQVKVMPDDAGANTTCASPNADLSGWAALIAPSTGVLSTGTFEVAPVDDPCELPSTGGYRGLENQLYRVEIHDAGALGSATFKWSRENASVCQDVTSSNSATEVEVASLGRDDVLRFNTGDWVEIIDDVREFSQLPGEIRRITVDEATRRLTFAPGLPASMLPASFPNSDFPATRHLRVRRWDHKGKVFRSDSSGNPVQIQDLDAPGSKGVIAVPGGNVEVLLEDGVTVSFASTGTTGFRTGDYWVFAARTADASVEILNREPPRGIHHHYARLAIWDVTAGSLTDCRNPWPPSGGGDDCSCTACVTPQSHTSGQFTIQDAVNKVSQTGGTVCLGPGSYPLQAPVRMVGARSVRIRGQGPNTVIICPTGGFTIERSMAIAIENLSLLSLSGATTIAVDGAIGLSLKQLVIALFAATNKAVQGAAIALQGVVAGAKITENAIFAPVAILANDPAADPGADQTKSAFLLTAALAIEDNLFWCSRQAITLVEASLHLLGTRIAGNEIVGCAEPAVSLLGLGAPGSSLMIRENSFSVTGVGIRCGIDGAWIEDNKIVNTATTADARKALPVGIALMVGLDRNGADQCQILANQVSGFTGAGIRIAAPTSSLIIKLNIIESCGNGILLTDSATGGSVSIENNQLRDIGGDADSTLNVYGIGVQRTETTTIAGNIIRSLGVASDRSSLRVGIFAVSVSKVRIFANELSDIAPPGDFLGSAAGIMIRAPFAEFEVSNNNVERDSTPSTVASKSAWVALVVVDTDPATQVQTQGGVTTLAANDSQMLVLGAGRPFLTNVGVGLGAVVAAQAANVVLATAKDAAPKAAAQQAAAQQAAANAAGAPAAGAAASAPAAAAPGLAINVNAAAAAADPNLPRGSILGNIFQSRGPAPTTEIAARGEVIFNNNRVESRQATLAPVIIVTDIALISANRVKGGSDFSIQVANASRAAVLGNITTASISIPNGLQDPWKSLNLRG
ncbi:MAG TPA: DUF6519 domain-containing protein [Gemmatimonadaceae bacterium]|jgi:hypothetical protein